MQILGFVNLWVGNVSLKLINEEIEMNKCTSVDWSSFCREVLLANFIENKEMVGGPGIEGKINLEKANITEDTM